MGGGLAAGRARRFAARASSALRARMSYLPFSEAASVRKTCTPPPAPPRQSTTTSRSCGLCVGSCCTSGS
jgi:hypothetical protein